MNHTLIDSHCHPPPLAENEAGRLPDWLQGAIECGVSECIAVGTDPDDWSAHCNLAASYPEHVHWTAGLHPCHVEDDFRSRLELLPPLLECLEGRRPCALGEIGLDFTKLSKDIREERAEQQREAFSTQLQWAKRFQLPVVIHSRGTVLECLEIIQQEGFPAERTLFHCFVEGPETLAKIRAAGAKCSFTGIITFKNAREVRSSLETNGLENLILETDSPYLSPEPFRGRRNEPARVSILADYCADFFGTTRERIAEITRRNTENFFDF